ncbi:hypothetical protein Bbelb_439630 [Branchiostoma belcheri]|nr:hypothetical protein Bbelb_439630 [Branchiostoma belcheri]
MNLSVNFNGERKQHLPPSHLTESGKTCHLKLPLRSDASHVCGSTAARPARDSLSVTEVSKKFTSLNNNVVEPRDANLLAWRADSLDLRPICNMSCSLWAPDVSQKYSASDVLMEYSCRYATSLEDFIGNYFREDVRSGRGGQTTAAARYGGTYGPSASGARWEKRRLAVPSDPMMWSPEHVRQWLHWAIKEYNLQGVEPARFDMDGKELCRLQRDDFVRLTNVHNGDVLFAHLLFLRPAMHQPVQLDGFAYTPPSPRPSPNVVLAADTGEFTNGINKELLKVNLEGDYDVSPPFSEWFTSRHCEMARGGPVPWFRPNV